MPKKKIEANGNTAALYARFSSDNQREESIDAQIRACREYAKSNGLEVVNVYTDSAKTGTNSNREGFQNMIADSAKREFRYIISTNSTVSPVTVTTAQYASVSCR